MLAGLEFDVVMMFPSTRVPGKASRVLPSSERMSLARGSHQGLKTGWIARKAARERRPSFQFVRCLNEPSWVAEWISPRSHSSRLESAAARIAKCTSRVACDGTTSEPCCVHAITSREVNAFLKATALKGGC
jgi:hypothetical protein